MALPVRVLLAAVLSLCLAPPAGAGFDDGRAAYQRGGHAQNNLGIAYFHGLGVDQNDGEAVR